MKNLGKLTWLASAFMIAGCSAQNTVPDIDNSTNEMTMRSAAGAVLAANPRPSVASAVGGSFSSFDAWKSAFRQRALNSGIRAETYDRAAPLMTYYQRVVTADRSQPEFKQTTADYVTKRVSNDRVSRGRDQWQKYGSQIRQIAREYQVDESVLMGIWGMETNFGGYLGGINVFTAMSTLAYDGRRRNFAETQMINALHIVQRGDFSPNDMEGSWASGLGHTQFIPEMYNIYAVDYNRDGRRNVFDPIEAIASTANFLRNEGWRPGMVWGAEVALPSGFNRGLIGKSNFQSPDYWRGQGIRAISSRGLPNANFAIIVPEGTNRAFAVTPNFRQIRRYNPSDNYILAVSVLGDTTLGYMNW